MTARYKQLTRHGHPNANCKGDIREHVLVMSELLGRALTSEEVVHHKDNDGLNNAPDNLQLFANRAEHNLHHARERASLACGNADFIKCGYCGTYDDPLNMVVNKVKVKGHHKKCHTEYQKKWRQAKKVILDESIES